MLSCVACDTDFVPADPRQKSCSPKCAQKVKPKHHKRWSLTKLYGITEAEWDAMFDAQGGCCKICNTHQSNLKKTLHVDHDHKTGRIRGLLCQKCNHGIGLFSDDPENLRRAAEYLHW